MGISSNQSVYARDRHAADCGDDQGKAQAQQRLCRKAWLYACLIVAALTSPVLADTYRIATYNTELQRRGPGLLLRDILSGKDAQVLAVADVIKQVSPDVLLLNGFDYDAGGVALTAFANLLNDYPYRFALRPNTGLQTGLDMDGDGRVGGPRDAQGYGRFAGQGGMAILSRYPLDAEHAQDFSALKWADFPDALLPVVDGKLFPSSQAVAAQRLSSVGHWVVPVELPNGVINLMAFHAGPPVFDGPEDRNGKRNHDEVRFWNVYLDGGLDTQPASDPFVILGDANQDPLDGEGLKDAIRGLLAHPLVQDPLPKSKEAVLAAQEQGGANARHQTNPALDTVDWKDTPVPGNMRVDYVLPSKDLQIAGAGVYWPVGEAGASRHHLVWVDVEMEKQR